VKRWPEGDLWRQSDFLKLWSAETVSQCEEPLDVILADAEAIAVPQPHV
jgi:hypothetical protein